MTMVPPDSQSSRQITRTYRAAIRLGEDFITLEETITLPLEASDEEITQAVELGWRIYTAQHTALERQVAALREAHGPQAAPASPGVRDPEAPASEKQRSYIARLQRSLRWSEEEMRSYASERGYDLLVLSKGQASEFIDGLKRLSEEAEPYDASAHPLTEQQHKALGRLAGQRGLDLDAEARRLYSVAAGELTEQQASELIVALQRNRTDEG